MFLGVAPLFSFNPLYRTIKSDFSGFLSIENLISANELCELAKSHSFEQSSITLPTESLRIVRGVPLFKVTKPIVLDEEGREEVNFLKDQIIDETDVVIVEPPECQEQLSRQEEEDEIEQDNEEEEENEDENGFLFDKDLFTGF